MPISLSSFSLIYALLLLLPGFLTYKLAIWLGTFTKKIDRFDKTIYSVIGSGLSLSITLIIFTLLTSFQLNNVRGPQYSLVGLSVAYICMVIIALIIGVLVGYIIDLIFYHGSDVRSETTWQLFIDGKEEPTEVHAVMNNGDEIWGEVMITDSEPHGQDILLKYPEKIIRGDGTNTTEKVPIGNYVFLSESDISHIYIDTDINV